MFAQIDSFEIKFEEQYEKNIKLSRINGIYIPNDLQDAFKELKDLSTGESLDKFSNASEQTVAQKLHFGLGRWMIYNWNFYNGSRFSHYLKERGLSHPDDMAKFVIITFHRYLNEQPLEKETLISNLKEARNKYLEENEILWKPGIKRDTIGGGN